MTVLASSASRFALAAVASTVSIIPLPAVAASVSLPSLKSSARSVTVQLPEERPVLGLPYVITPERRALLNTIRYAEGTGKVALTSATG